MVTNDEPLCAQCPGLCCKYVTVKISPPRLRCDRDEHRWLLMHENIEIRIEGRKWYLLVETRCRNLSKKDDRCAIYPDRPDTCEDYQPDGCDFDGEDDAVRFRSVEEYDRYLAERGMPWRPRKRG